MKKVLTSISLAMFAVVVGFSFAACKKTPKLEGTYSFSTVEFMGLSGSKETISRWLDSAGDENKGMKSMLDILYGMEVTLNDDDTATFFLEGFGGILERYVIDQYGSYMSEDDLDKHIDYFAELGIWDDGLNTPYTKEDGVIRFGKVYVGKPELLESWMNSYVLQMLTGSGGLNEDGMMSVEGLLNMVDSYVYNNGFYYYSLTELTETEIDEFIEKHGMKELYYHGESSYWDSELQENIQCWYYEFRIESKGGYVFSDLKGAFVSGKLELNMVLQNFSDRRVDVEHELDFYPFNDMYYYASESSLKTDVKIVLKK